jgi:hypothetical protein
MLLLILCGYILLNLCIVLYLRYQDSNTGWLHYYHRKAKNARNSDTR